MRTQSKQSNIVPLAARMRPESLDQYVGQEKVIGKGTLLRDAIENGTIGSLILWGPPGVGKTTLAYLIADRMEAEVERVSAVAAGVKELRGVLARAKERLSVHHKTVLIVDEIHRFNKSQQDILLPAVEDGTVTLIGATTENPYFEVIAALVSRVTIVRLLHLSDENIETIIQRAFASEQGLEKKKLVPDALKVLVRLAGGDARRALSILEKIAFLNDTTITVKDIEASAQQSVVQYDKKGDAHYDTISAFIKSMRGSDADAALFYLFRMLLAGEDPKFIVRRMFIFASEDIGNADPHALMLVAAVSQTLEWVGLPEAEFVLAHAAVYLSAAPKSNSIYVAKERAKEDVQRHGNAVPPAHITNAPIAGLKQFGKGVGYKYPHDFPEHLVQQQYRPSVIQQTVYYEPTAQGFEKEVKRRVDQAKKILGRS